MNNVDELNKLFSLLKSGVINQDEFENLKNEILGKNKPNRVKPKVNLSNQGENSTKKTFIENHIKKAWPIYVGIFIVVIYIFIKGSHSSDEKEIMAICSECTHFEKIPNTNWIFTTKINKLSNIYDTEIDNFILENWYQAKFDNGIFYDDIIFTINGKKVICSEYYYDELSDNFLTLRSERITGMSYKELNTPPEGYERGRSCSGCSGTGYYTHDALNVKAGGVCASCNGKGYHWVKK